ncbi:MAG: outer membrane protein TolC [Paraglaciecola sp.]|jgi:outer membrane protein TolC
MNINILIVKKTVRFALLSGLWCSVNITTSWALTLEHAIEIAQHNDPWQSGNQLRERALLAQGAAVDTLPDPVLSLGMLNLPANGYALDQEPMTQVKLGISQMFPRGESRTIARRQLELLAGQQPLLGENRRAQVKVTVSTLWLDASAADKSINLLAQERELFEQLADFVQTSYSSAQGKTRQQDVVRAHLEIARLQDRLTLLHKQKDTAMAKLVSWLWTDEPGQHSFVSGDSITLDGPLPDIKLAQEASDQLKGLLNSQQRVNILTTHPAVQAIKQRIKAGYSSVKLAEQKYLPQWAVNAGYAYRQDDQQGRSRADFLSLGVSMSMPFFSTKRQDNDVQASQLTNESLKTDLRLLLRNMLAQLDVLTHQYQRLDQRAQLYANSILPQMHQQAEASLSAYTNDEGDFEEVMRARIAEFNGRMEQITILANRLKIKAQIGYFFSKGTQNQHTSVGVVK